MFTLPHIFPKKDLILVLGCEIKRNQEDNAIKDFWGGKENIGEIYFKSLKINRCESLGGF